MIAVANAAKTKLNAVANVAATKLTTRKKAKLPSKLPLLELIILKAHVGQPAWAFLYPVKFLVDLGYGEKIYRGI